MESFLVAVLADGATPKVETDQFDREVDAVPWDLSPEEIRAQLVAARQRILASTAPDSALRLAQSAASALTSVTVREKVFRAMCSIMFSNKEINRPEATVLGLYAEMFQVPRDRLDEIKHDVKS